MLVWQWVLSRVTIARKACIIGFINNNRFSGQTFGPCFDAVFDSLIKYNQTITAIRWIYVVDLMAS
jgi:hypothetical protein